MQGAGPIVTATAFSQCCSAVQCPALSVPAALTILESDQTLPSKGMYSMNLTLIGRSRVSSRKAGISSSFTPRISTTLT